MSNENHHGPHCAGLCEGKAYSSRIKQLEGVNERLRGDAVEGKGIILALYEALGTIEQLQLRGYITLGDTISTEIRAALAKARGEQS